MNLVLRRLLAAGAVATALFIGLPGVVAQAAPSPSPSGSASSKAGHASASPSAGTTSEEDNPEISSDSTVDNSRIVWVLSGVGVVAIAAAAFVIARP